VFHAQHLDGELNHRETVEICVHHDVRDVPMHEELARRESHDLIGRHAAVGAADPQVFRRLLLGEPLEEIRIAPRHLGGPRPVAVEELVQDGHRAQ
jgi:hypothetical protein